MVCTVPDAGEHKTPLNSGQVVTSGHSSSSAGELPVTLAEGGAVPEPPPLPPPEVPLLNHARSFSVVLVLFLLVSSTNGIAISRMSQMNMNIKITIEVAPPITVL